MYRLSRATPLSYGFVATLYYAPELQGELGPFVQQELKAPDQQAAIQEAQEWVRERHKPPYKYVRLKVRRGDQVVHDQPINDRNQ